MREDIRYSLARINSHAFISQENFLSPIYPIVSTIFSFIIAFKAKFPSLSYAELYTLAGVVAIQGAGGPTIPYRLGRGGKISGTTSPPEGRLPDAGKGTHAKNIQHIREVFSQLRFLELIPWEDDIQMPQDTGALGK